MNFISQPNDLNASFSMSISICPLPNNHLIDLIQKNDYQSNSYLVLKEKTKTVSLTFFCIRKKVNSSPLMYD